MTEQKQAPMPEPTTTVSQIGPRVANFSDEVIKSPEGVAVMNSLEGVIKRAVDVGFPEEKARRATSLWLIDIAWMHLMKMTSVLQETFLAITNQPRPTDTITLADVVPGNEPGPTSGNGAPDITAEPQPSVDPSEDDPA